MKLISAQKSFEGLTVKIFNIKGQAYADSDIIDLDSLHDEEKANIWERYVDGDLVEYIEPVSAGTATKKIKE